MVPEKSKAPAKKKSPKAQSPKVQKVAKEAEEILADESSLETSSTSSESHAPQETSAQGESRPTAPFKEGDDYTFIVRYDKALKLFVGEVAEVSDCKAKGLNREEVLRDLKIKLEDFLEDHRHQGGVPEPIFSKRYPETLSVSVTQSLFRKLDLLSRMEKASLDQVVTELLSSAADRRLESGKGGQKHSQPHSSQQPRHNHHGGRHGGGHGGGHNRNRHSQNLDSRENFMEYVRNLEKGGNRWKK